VYVLTFNLSSDSLRLFGSVLREIAASPAPELDGLCLRHWRIDQRRICGRYFFSDRKALHAFRCEPRADPAYRQIAAFTANGGTLKSIVEELPRAKIIERPVFIISAPRAGSTLLYDLLSLSTNAWTIDGESEGVIEGIRHLHVASRGFDSHRLTDLDADDDTVRVLQNGFVADLRDSNHLRYLETRSAPQQVRLVEKTPENSLRVSFLAASFPDAFFVFLHRDARQSVSSMIEAWGHESFITIPKLPGWSRGAWHLLLPAGWRAMHGRPLVEIAAFQWAAANSQALDALEALPGERWATVDFDELIATPEIVVRRICELAQLDTAGRLEAALSRPLPVSATTISPPSSLKWRQNPDFHESVLRPYNALRARLRDLDQHAPPPRRPAVSSVRFSCFLNEIDAEPALPAIDDWRVNPSFQFQPGVTIPLQLLRQTRFRERFLQNYPLVWIEDEATAVNYPFWVDRNQVYLFRQFVAGEPPPPLESEFAGRLARARIILTAKAFDERRRAARARAEHLRDQFAEQRYCELPALINEAHAKALGRYYRELIRSGWELGDAQVSNRYGQHNEVMARYFHHQFTAFLDRIAGEPIKPSYTYVSAYRAGAMLRAHVDRKQCEFTLSLVIDGEDAECSSPWPLWLNASQGKVALTQRTGDGVLFRGCELPHWREPSATPRDSTILLFHYVAQDFDEVLD